MNRIWRSQARHQARRQHVRAVRHYNRGDRWARVDSGYHYSPTVVRRIVGYRQPAYYQPGNGYDYRYAGGYAYRIDPQTQLIAALLPLLGGAFGIGQTLPTGYDVYNLPTQYRSIYPDDGAYGYRYGDNAIYRVDRSNGQILGVPQLLTNGFQVGRPMPAGYGAYNVPYDYRDRYYDSDEHLYRYNNGRIYQVDAESMLVRAAIDLLV
ncbi:MAG: hypothetical protein LC634_07650 [Sphingomonadales bacterium]|nr:hypothetical protein [Sphingomonadales bacterium]